MKLKAIGVENFRLFKNLFLGMSDIMLLVGKNNSGKTSFFEILEIFLGDKSFSLADFSKGLISRISINELYKEYDELEEKTPQNIKIIENKIPKIELRITIDLSNTSDYSKIKPLIYEFKNNEEIILVSQYKISSLEKLFFSYNAYKLKMIELNKTVIDFFDFLLEEYEMYFKIEHYATKNGSTENSPLIDHMKIKELFKIHVIKARRDVDDSSDQNKHIISNSLWKHYLYNNQEELKNKHIYLEQTNEIKKSLDAKYQEIFKEVLTSIHTDLLLSEADSKIEIKSDFDVENMFKSNARLRYIMDDFQLSEAYNGLGFSNLIYMFVEIYHFNHISKIEEKPFNILFIEEPEAHLHPQMQLTLYKKLKSVLNSNIKANIILTTHSSHLLSISEFGNINYFFKDENGITVKSLETFINKNGGFEIFLRKYFRINISDLFFSDKAILYEGAAERLLFPVFLRKYDLKHNTKLSSQHISLFEVGGRYAHIFFKLLEYLGMKSLIVADIDSVEGKKKVSCNVKNDVDNSTKTIKTSNGVVKSWFDMIGKDLFVRDLITKKDDSEKNEFEIKKNGRNMFLSTQLPINTLFHCGRTLEEELIIHNAHKIMEDFNKKIDDTTHDLKFPMLFESFEISGKIDQLFIINKAFDVVNELDKTGFALELIENLEEWDIPPYIEEGLTWLEK